jgi:hypothetical protein
MGYKMKCSTLFEIDTAMNKKVNISSPEYVAKCNMDTIMQIISLRCQPEEVSEVIMEKITLPSSFGKTLNGKAHEYTFYFQVAHSGVFDDGNSELGGLLSDCNGVPMVTQNKSIKLLDTTNEQRNIHFEILENV